MSFLLHDAPRGVAASLLVPTRLDGAILAIARSRAAAAVLRAAARLSRDEWASLGGLGPADALSAETGAAPRMWGVSVEDLDEVLAVPDARRLRVEVRVDVPWRAEPTRAHPGRERTAAGWRFPLRGTVVSGLFSPRDAAGRPLDGDGPEGAAYGSLSPNDERWPRVARIAARLAGTDGHAPGSASLDLPLLPAVAARAADLGAAPGAAAALWVTRPEVEAALGLLVPATANASALAALADVVELPTFAEGPGGTPVPTGASLSGREALSAIGDGFGRRSHVRRIHVRPDLLAGLEGTDDGAPEAAFLQLAATSLARERERGPGLGPAPGDGRGARGRPRSDPPRQIA